MLDEIQPVKCRVLASFESLECFYYVDIFDYVCHETINYSAVVLFWLYTLWALNVTQISLTFCCAFYSATDGDYVVLKVANVWIAQRSVNEPIAFLELYGSTSAKLGDDDGLC
jgi:hypothetical protein